MPTSEKMTKDERHLLDRAAQSPRHNCLAELTPEVLRNVSQQEGIDFATALLFDRIVRSPEHRPFVERMQELQQRDSAAASRIDATVAFVPGAFYVEHPQTGADAAVLLTEAAGFGCPTARIPTLSIGTTAENGRIICAWLSGQTADRIILVSLSKGGADVKMALAEPDAKQAFRNVVAWINLGGILQGSPMVAWTLSRRLPSLFCRLLFWIRGRDYQFVRDLDRRAGSTLDFELRPPEHMRLIHVAAFTLPRHTSSRRARRWYRRLSSFGPNDSVMMLADIGKLPGLILPVWGTDHYLQSRWNSRSLFAALLQYLAEELDLFRPAAAADMVTQ